MKKNYIIEGDSLEVLKQFPKSIVDIVITSPPYNVAHDYDNYDDNMDEKEYMELMTNVFREIYRVLTDDGRVCINVPFAIKNRETKKVSFLASKFAEIMNEIGFKDFEWITWHKGRNINHFQGNNTAWGSWKSPSSPSFRPMGEAVMVFYKKEKRMVRSKDTIDISGDEFKNWTKNVWYFDEDDEVIYEGVMTIPNNASKKNHPAPFPVELIERLLKLYSYEGSLVLDPFNGIGTTSVACQQNGRRFIGIDQSKLYTDLSKKRLNEDKTIRMTYDMNYSNLVNPKSSEGTLNEYFPYKESYSPQLLNNLIERYSIENYNSIYDPFVGTGSSFTNDLVSDVFGTDVSPFALNVAQAKILPLSTSSIREAAKLTESLTDLEIYHHQFPEWKPFSKYVCQEKYNIVKSVIDYYKGLEGEVSNFVSYLIYSNLDKIFDYKRDGNGIKFRKSKIQKEDLLEFLRKLILSALESKGEFDKTNRIDSARFILSSSTNFNLEEEVDIVLTSPPYANMFDYFEVYKMELWTSGLVESYEDWRALKKTALRSNLNTQISPKDMLNNVLLSETIEHLRSKNTDNRTINMINNYFFDMKKTMKNIYPKLKEGSYFFIVVGNSFYNGVPVATDIILGDIAKNIGFKLEDIIIARKLNTSPQQMKIISPKDKMYLRESIIVLRKCRNEE